MYSFMAVSYNIIKLQLYIILKTMDFILFYFVIHLIILFLF